MDTRTICVCPFMPSHDALTSLTSQSRKFSCILCTWRTGFRVARRLGGHGFESRVADLATSRGVEGSLAGFPGGPRSQAGSRADEVDRTVPEVYQSGAVSVHFCTASGSVQFGTLLTLLSSKARNQRTTTPQARMVQQNTSETDCDDKLRGLPATSNDVTGRLIAR